MEERGTTITAKYGVGRLGAGWVAGEYLKVFHDHPLTEVVGIYNRTPGKATALLQKHGIQASSMKAWINSLPMPAFRESAAKGGQPVKVIRD